MHSISLWGSSIRNESVLASTPRGDWSKKDEMEEGVFLVASLGRGTVLFNLYREATLSGSCVLLQAYGHSGVLPFLP